MAKSANVLALEDALAEVKRLREVVRQERENAKVARETKREASLQAALERHRIAMLKVQGQLANPVGIKAKRASKRPSEVVSIPV